MLGARIGVMFVIAWVAPTLLWGGHTLTATQQGLLTEWLRHHSQYRAATTDDCGCSDDVAKMKRGHGGVWVPVPDYDPYVATGDFNTDGIEDFAVVLVDRSARIGRFALLVFNGPFRGQRLKPAFVETGLDLAHQGMFFGPPRPEPYRLLLGGFESEGAILEPKGDSYTWNKEP